MCHMTEYSPAKTGEYPCDISQVLKLCLLQKKIEEYSEDINLGTFCCSSKLTVFLELCSQRTVRFLEQIMSVGKYLSIWFANRGNVNLAESSSRTAKAFLEISLKKKAAGRWSGLEQPKRPGTCVQ